MEIQFTPQYVDGAKPGKKYGTIKDTAGARFLIPFGVEGMFAKGQPVNIRYEHESWCKDGIVRAVNGQQLNSAAPAPPLPATQQTVAQAPLTPPRASDTAEEIFVTGIVGRAMGSGQFSVTDIALLAKAATQAWRERQMPPPPVWDYSETNPPPADPTGR